MQSSGARSDGRRDRTRRLASQVYLAVLASWLLLPFLWYGTLAQDGLAFDTAARLAFDDNNSIYAGSEGGLFDVKPAFRDLACSEISNPDECDEFIVAFVSPPLALPLVLPFRLVSHDSAMLFIRLVAAAALAAGMHTIWRLHSDRSPGAPVQLAAMAIALTPLATSPIGLGQTSPLLFLVALHPPAASGRKLWLPTLAWVAAIAFKLFPLGLAPLLLKGRHRALLIMSAIVALLIALSFTVDGIDLWREFFVASEAISDQTAPNPYNGAIESVVYQLTGTELSPTAPALVGLRMLLVGVVLSALLRVHDDGTRWAAALLALVVLMPQAWWHYGWVALGALAVAASRTDRPLPFRALIAMPFVALPVSFANTRGWSVPTAQFALMIATLAIVLWTAAFHPVQPKDDGATLAGTGVAGTT